MFVCLGSLILSFTRNFFAYFKFYSDWGRVIRKIKQNGLDSRDTAPLIIKDSWVKQKMNWSPTSAAPKTAGRFWQPKKLPTEWAFISDSLIKVMNITRPAKSRNSRSSLRRYENHCRVSKKLRLTTKTVFFLGLLLCVIYTDVETQFISQSG